MIQLSPRDLLLVKVLEGGVDNILRFRVSNNDSLDDIDELERVGLLRKVDDRYMLSLVAIEDLRAKRIIRADSIYHFCGHLLQVLQRLYEREPGSRFSLDVIAQEAEASGGKVQQGWAYLYQAPIWAGFDGSATAFTAITPKEEILRFEDIRSIVAFLREQLEEQNRPQSDVRMKDQKFRVLDSPALLASDLTRPSGLLGRAVIYLDLDDFKALNTRLTEVVVDRLVLPPFHQLLADCVEGNGHAYAEGGDEFTILLPNTTEKIAVDFAEALQAQMATLMFAGEAQGVRLSASIGLAYSVNDQEGPALHQRANEAKRSAKENGKHCTMVWSPDGCRLVR
jgi:diguanylate cyclase (GGDEF)-like protein